MRKKTIAILFIIGIVVAVIGVIVYGAGLAGAVSTATVASDGTVSGVNTGLAGLALVGALVIVLGGIFSTISWVGALVATGRQGRWGWFCCVFFLLGLGELIYLIAGPGL